ncbi:MAG TPA: M12 family metallo-peptidase, partial [Candidatus Thermoplasmatota archaeon]|nr:M12 family metallo-peptidase [Candidatus Thermoplasmatota archaeon]
ELEAPEAPETVPAATGSVDGVLQILLDGDHEYWLRLGDSWDEYQLAVVSLVDLIYRAELGFGIEVVGQHVWTSPGPLSSSSGFCSGVSPDLLVQFTQHWESVAPTTRDVREAAHLFTGKTFAGGYVGCGWIGQLETSRAYAVSRVGYAEAAKVDRAVAHRDALLVAHEIGHNFAGQHGRAAPTPGGVLDLLRTGCLNGATIMYPCVLLNSPAFSEAPPLLAGPLASADVMQDGGNAPWMRAYATGRI